MSFFISEYKLPGTTVKRNSTSSLFIVTVMRRRHVSDVFLSTERFVGFIFLLYFLAFVLFCNGDRRIQKSFLRARHKTVNGRKYNDLLPKRNLLKPELGI